jgi:hypothetical protein
MRACIIAFLKKVTNSFVRGAARAGGLPVTPVRERMALIAKNWKNDLTFLEKGRKF